MILSNFKIPTMKSVCSVGQRMKKMMKKRIRSMKLLMIKWIHAAVQRGMWTLIVFSSSSFDANTSREVREQEELAKFRSERPKIQTQFVDLKRNLSAVTTEEWENLPEVGNLTRKKRKRDERTFAVPDSILVGDREKNQYESSLDPSQEVWFHQFTNFSYLTYKQTNGLVTPAASDTLSNLVEIGQARDRILSLKLDQLSGAASASGTSTSVDPKGYLTDLNSVIHKTESEIGDIKRARMLFDSLIKSNPKHAPGWIAAANLEEHAGRMVQARKLIREGCKQCPRSEDIWLESARLHVGVFIPLLP
jgi:pre-mRNA-processing factor 6